MKKCKNCGQSKTHEEFYAVEKMRDGRDSLCKACRLERVKIYREANIDKIRSYDRARGKTAARVAATVVQTKKWRQEDTRRSRGHNAVARAIRKGELEPLPCRICGSHDAYAHHENYDKPLDVVWYCQPHHKERHKQMAIEGIEP